MNIDNILIRKDDLRLRYKPQSDITAFELAHLLHLFSVAGGRVGSVPFMPLEFIEEHGLERHFEKVLK